MQKVLSLLILLFSASSWAQTEIVLNEKSQTVCNQVLLSRIENAKLKVTSPGCSFEVSKSVAEQAGYSLAELQRLIVDSSKGGFSATLVVQDRVATDIHTEIKF